MRSAVKLTAPALARLSANTASPSCSPAYSRAATMNAPSSWPKSGMISRHTRADWSKKLVRTWASDTASRNTPEPDTATDLTPAPASSSRQRPVLSLSVMSRVLALRLIVRARRPATVWKVGVGAPSLIFSSMSLPAWAAMGGSLF